MLYSRVFISAGLLQGVFFFYSLLGSIIGCYAAGCFLLYLQQSGNKICSVHFVICNLKKV